MAVAETWQISRFSTIMGSQNDFCSLGVIPMPVTIIETTIPNFLGMTVSLTAATSDASPLTIIN